MYSGNIREITSFMNLDVIESGDSQYQISLQAGIWNIDNLLKILIPNETPWEVELNGTERLKSYPDLKVYGTRQWPMKYQIVVDKGEFKRDGSWMFPPRQLSYTDFEELKGLGYVK
jgi:hypothetical protein